jgi:CubicO group peptidase (beta-lactamase class C family)
MKATTPMHLASVGKVLTATAVFRLIETFKT